jgi:pyruvate formate lyase activating enzyme
MGTLAVGGFVPFTTVDFPGRHAAVVFCRGCPWRCGYCHNAHLQGPGSGPDWTAVRAVLEKRRGLLEGVVFSGGEPLLQPALPEAVAQVRGLGYAVGLHTGGSDPEAFRRVLPGLAWVGFDLKAPWDRYDALTGTPGSGEAARRSLEHLIAEGIPFQIRTTVDPEFLREADLQRMRAALADLGIREWTRQPARPVPRASAPS